MQAYGQETRPAGQDMTDFGTLGAEQGVDDTAWQRASTLSLKPGHLEQHRIVAHNRADTASMVFDLLRTQVLQKMDEKGWRTLAITSPIPEVGKTVVSINLAMSIAHLTTKTALLADFDLRRPKIAKYLGLPADISLNEVFEGKAHLEEAMVNPGIPRLAVLPTRAPVESPAETLTSARGASLMKEMRGSSASRIVIFDLPPLLSSDDAIAVLPQIDCVLLVVGEGMSSDKEIEQCLRYLPSANLIGTVLNKAEETSESYYYY